MTSRGRCVCTVTAPFGAAALYFVFAAAGAWGPAIVAVMLLTFLTYASTSHELVHRNLGLSRRTNDVLLSLVEMLCLRSGTAYRLSHIQHHRHFPGPDDIEVAAAGRGWRSALASGPTMQFRLWIWAWRTHPRRRRALAGEAMGFVLALTAGGMQAYDGESVFPLYVALVVAGSWFFPLATVHIPHDPEGTTPLTQTRAFRGLFFDLLALGHLYHLEHHLYPMVPKHHWRTLAARLDPYLEQAGVVPRRFP